MNIEKLQSLTEEMIRQERDRERKTSGILSEQLLKIQNTAFADTLGVSRNNREQGFVPAYQDSASGRVAASRFADGRPAPIHVLDGLPETWIQERDIQGRVVKARPGIVAGFLHGKRFYTREQAARAASH